MSFFADLPTTADDRCSGPATQRPAQGGIGQRIPGELPLGHLHLWSVGLDRPAAALAALAGLLSADERTRADRILFPLQRRRWIAARGTLRGLLGSYLGLPPAEVPLETGWNGKPQVAGGTDLRFNLSHCEHQALYGLVRGREVGVDLERVRDLEGLPALVRRFLTSAEIAELEALPAAERARGFLVCWTRKEALLKARGTGLGADPRALEVGVGCAPPADRGGGSSPGWTLFDLVPALGFVGAAALGVAASERLASGQDHPCPRISRSAAQTQSCSSLASAG